MKPLGEILTAQGLISPDQLSHALSRQQQTNSRLGNILIASGAINYLPLYRIIAEHHQLPFVNLLQDPPDAALLSFADAEIYLEHRAIPWRREGHTLIVAVAELNADIRAWVAQRYGDAQLVITSPLDIRKAVENIFGELLEEKSRLSLWQQTPHASARTTMAPYARDMLYACIFIACAWVVATPLKSAVFVIAFCSISYCATMLIKSLIFACGTKRRDNVDWQPALQNLDEKTLPVYSILIPMYREAASLPGMLAAMQRMDYPPEKLDIKIVLEADDMETIHAAMALKPRYQFEIIRVPPGPLRTKPKACNYALRFARGEYITVFDADDRPDPLQLKKAIIHFRSTAPDVACLQARLNYYNAPENLLTRFFAFEYTILFDVLLHGLQRMRIPLPLGGTSNHLSLARLRALGEWDPYNVTEDADLGVRLAALGFRTEMLDSFTMEEAPTAVPAWVRQRSRWIKGYMQTWLVHMRHPRMLYRSLGMRSFWGFQFFVGFSSFTFLSAPLVWMLAIGWWAMPQSFVMQRLPDWLLWLAACNFLLNIATHWYMTFHCLRYMPNDWPNRRAALIYPIYLALHSVASYKALWQLIVKPHFWEKTTHGVTRHQPQEISLTAAH